VPLNQVGTSTLHHFLSSLYTSSQIRFSDLSFFEISYSDNQFVIDDPQDAEVARQYKSDKKMFEYTAKMWTDNFAKESTIEDKMKKLLEMGFPEDVCKEAL
jgi:hypothetical protein